MLKIYGFILSGVSFALIGCSGGDDNSEEKNLAPVIELQAPTSALSLEAISITSKVIDPEGDSVSLLWQLSADSGFKMELTDVDELSYQIPLTHLDTEYTVSLTATDSHGNQASKSSSFTVPALDVNFTHPFDAISLRYVDTEAKLLNIASEDVNYSWEISEGSDYPLTSISANRVRFFAAKELTEEFDPNAEPERIRGEGITEDLVITLTVENESTPISFNKTITVQPIEKVTAWAVHNVAASGAPVKESVPSTSNRNYVEAVDNCLSRETTVKKYYDYNQDGIDDVFCSFGDKLYFYLTDLSASGDLVYNESVLVDNQYNTDGAVLVDLDNSGIPELVLAVKSGGNITSPSEANTIAALVFDDLSQGFTQRGLFDLPEISYDIDFVEENNKLSMAYITSGVAHHIPKVSVFDIFEAELTLENSFVFNECSECSIEDLVLSDLNGLPAEKELLLITKESIQLGAFPGSAPRIKKLAVIKDNYTSSTVFPENFYSIFQEDLNGNSALEWVGETAYETGLYDITLPEFKLHLSLDQSGEPSTEMLDNYYSDIFYYYYKTVTQVDVNQDNQQDSFTEHHNYYSAITATPGWFYYTYNLSNSDKRVLITSMPYNGISSPDFLGVEDMNNNGFLDIKFGVKASGDEEENVTLWLENIEGYPFE